MTVNAAVIGAVLIIAIGALIGYTKGIIGIVYSIISWIFVILFTIATNPYISAFLTDNTPLPAYINESVSSYISEKAEDMSSEEDIKTDSKDSDNDILGMYLPKAAYDAMVLPIEAAKESIASSVDAWKKNLIKTISNQVTTYIIQGISFVIAFVFAKIICLLIGIAINKVRKLPIIHGISSWIGVFVGAFNGLLVIWVIMYITSIALTTNWGGALYAMIEESMPLKYLYDNNVFTAFIVSRNL